MPMIYAPVCDKWYIHMNGNEPPKLGMAGAPPLGMEAWLTLKQAPSPYVLPSQIW